MYISIFLNKIFDTVMTINHTFFGNLTDQSTILVKSPYIHFATHHRSPIVVQGMNSGGYIPLCIEVVCFAVNFHKISLVSISCLIIPLTKPKTSTARGYLPYTLGSASFIKMIGNSARSIIIISGNSYLCFCIKVMPIVTNQHPTALEFTSDSITICIYCLILKQAAVLSLAFADTIFTEVIVVAVNNLDTGQFFAILIITIAIPSIVNKHTISVFIAVFPNTGIGLSASIMNALKNAIDNFIFMIGCRNNRTPFNY